MVLNACGLASKLGEFQHRVCKLNADVVIVTETKFTLEKITMAEASLPGYCNPIRLDRTAHGGGVCVWVKSTLAASRNDVMPVLHHEIVWVNIRLKTGKKIIIGAVYRPGSCPENDVSLINHIGTCLEQIDHTSAHVLLAGDFNVHNQAWLHSTKTSLAGEQLEELCAIYGLNQHVHQPTRAANTLDLIISDVPGTVCSKVLDPLGRSDHNIVIADFHSPVLHHEPRTTRTVWQYHRADWHRLRDYLRNTKWDTVLTHDPNASAEELTSIIQKGMDQFIPSKKLITKPSDPVWWSPACSRATRQKQSAWKKWRHHPDDPGYHQQFLDSLHHCSFVLCKAQEAHVQNVKAKLSSGNLRDKQWWTYVKRAGGKDRCSDIPLITDGNGKEYVTSKEKADCFGSFFANKCSLGDMDLSDSTLPDLPQPHHVGLSHIRFRPPAVRRVLAQLDSSKATGPDGISARVLKECSDVLAAPVSRLFQLLMKKGVQPDIWKLASVVPVHKRASRSILKNYRPVSLLCILSKVMETLVNRQVVNYLERHQLLSPHQYGFRRGLGTADLLIALHHEWAAAAGEGGAARLLAVDIAGAFDRVSHCGVIHKAESCGLRGDLLKWLRSYLSNRRLQALVGGQTSTAYPVWAGVPQGSILGPTLFILYVNDIADGLPPEVGINTYADDTTLYTLISEPSNTQHTTAVLQAAVNTIEKWGARWKVTFEPSKSQTLTVTHRRQPWPMPSLTFGGETVPEDSQLKLLGVVFDPKLSFKDHIRNTAARANQRLFFFRKACKVLDHKGRVTVYKGFIRPVLEYCPLAWMGAAPTHLGRLDRVQHRAMHMAGPGTLLPSLALRRTVAALCYLYKLQYITGPKQLTKLVPPPAPACAMPQRTRLQTAVRHRYQLADTLPVNAPNSLRRSFPYCVLSMWNNLPPDLVSVAPHQKGLQRFKTAVNKHLTHSHWVWATDY